MLVLLVNTMLASSPVCLQKKFTQVIYDGSFDNPSNNCFCEQGTWGNTPDTTGCELCPPGTYSDFTVAPNKPSNPSVVQISNRPDLTNKCAYYSPTTCAGVAAQGTPEPQCNLYGWPYGCKNCPCGKYNKGYGNTECHWCQNQASAIDPVSCPGGSSPGRTDCQCDTQGKVFLPVPPPSPNPDKWTATINSSPPAYSTTYTEGTADAWSNTAGITAYREHYGKGWYWVPSRKSNFNVARCSKQRKGYVEFVTTETQKNDTSTTSVKQLLPDTTFIEFYAKSDKMTYSATGRKMVMLPVKCISGFLGTCVTMESFSNAYGGQTGNNYQICSKINGVPTNIPFAGEEVDCTTDIGDTFYARYPNLGTKSYSDCKGYRGISQADGCPNAPDLTTSLRARKAAANLAIQTDIRSGGYYSFGRRRTHAYVVDENCNSFGITSDSCESPYTSGECLHDDDDDDNPQRFHAPSSDRLALYQAGDPCFMYATRQGFWATGGHAECGRRRRRTKVYGSSSATSNVGSHYLNCKSTSNNYHWLAFYPPDEGSRCGVGFGRGVADWLFTGHGAYLCSGFTINCASMATVCGLSGRRRRRRLFAQAPQPDCDTPIPAGPDSWAKTAAAIMGATKDANGNPAGQMNRRRSSECGAGKSACFTRQEGATEPNNANGAQWPGAYSSEFQDALSEAAQAGTGDDDAFDMNMRRRVDPATGRRRGLNGANRFPGGCLAAHPHQGISGSTVNPGGFNSADADTTNVPKNINWMLGSTKGEVPNLKRIAVNDDSGGQNGRYFGKNSLPCPSSYEDAKTSGLLQYFPYFVVRNLCERMGCYSDDPGLYETGQCNPCPAGTWTMPTSLGVNCGSQCFDCPAGQYSGEQGATNCVICPAGNYSTVGSPSCPPCPAGKYNTVEAAKTCTTCIPGWYQDQDGREDCIKCPPGKYSDTTGAGSCTACEAGRFQENEEAQLCNVCPPGKYTTETGKKSCVICQFGTASIGGTNECSSCPSGKFSWYDANDGSTITVGNCFTIFDASISQNAPTTGPDGTCAFAAACYCCPRGQFGLSKNTSLSDGQKTCSGSSQEKAKFQTCDVCPSGKHAKNPGTDACEDCPHGQYMPDSGRALCNECLPDHITSLAGSISASACTQCPVGHFPSPDRSSCRSCPSGKYVNAGTLECLDCPAGKYSVKDSQQSSAPCQVCLPGKYTAFAGAPECLNCPNGKYQASVASTGCVGPGCPLNYGSTIVAALSVTGTTCRPSPVNMYYNHTTGLPTSCPAGRYWESLPDVPEKTVLPAISLVSTHESATRACIYAGFDGLCKTAEGCQWSNQSRTGCDELDAYYPMCCVRTKECMPCTQGKFSTHCNEQCPLGKVASSENPLVCEYCKAGWKWSETSAACVPCEPKHVRSSSQLDESPLSCIECSTNTHASPNRTVCLSCAGNDAGYYMSAGSGCKQCPSGKFSTRMVDECTLCPNGKHTNLAASDHCTLVPNGKYSLNGTALSCPSGKYSTTQYIAAETTLNCSQGCVCRTPTSITSCPTAQTNGFADLTNATSECNNDANCYAIAKQANSEQQSFTYFKITGNPAQLKIVAGLAPGVPFSILIKVPPDGVFTNSTALMVDSTARKPYVGCLSCLAGEGSTPDGSECKLCPLGKYADKLGAGCNDCPAGEFTRHTGSLSCTECPPGYGEVSNACTACPAGRYKSASMGVCATCPHNTINTLTGQQSCTETCPAPNTDHTRCNDTFTCRLGNFWNETGGCSQCPAGQFSISINSVLCQECPRGQTNSIDSTHCVACPSGTGANENNSCVECVAGRFSQTVANASYCMNCPPGHSQALSGKNTCKKCVRGKYQDAPGQLTCKVCAIAKYAVTSGSSECTACPTGNRTAGNGSIALSDCRVRCSDCVIPVKYTESLSATNASASQSVNSDCTPVFKLDGAIAGTVLQGSTTAALEQVDECGAPIAQQRRRLQESESGLRLQLGADASEAYVAYKVAPTGTTIKIETDVSFPSACVYSTWGSYTSCSAPCYPANGNFRPLRYRNRTLLLSHGVPSCSGLLIERQECKKPVCPVPCAQYWGNWGSCSATCGLNSVQARLRVITQAPEHNAPPCEPPYSELRPCIDIKQQNMSCPVDCVYTETVANECTEQCGGGVYHVHYKITQKPLFGGKACPLSSSGRPCNTHPCPQAMQTPTSPVQYASILAIVLFVLTYIFNNRKKGIPKKRSN